MDWLHGLQGAGLNHLHPAGKVSLALLNFSPFWWMTGSAGPPPHNKVLCPPEAQLLPLPEGWGRWDDWDPCGGELGQDRVCPL